MTAQELIDHLTDLISDGTIDGDTPVWEERTGEHRLLTHGDVRAGRANIVYNADDGDEIEGPAVIFGLGLMRPWTSASSQIVETAHSVSTGSITITVSGRAVGCHRRKTQIWTTA